MRNLNLIPTFMSLSFKAYYHSYWNWQIFSVTLSFFDYFLSIPFCELHKVQHYTHPDRKLFWRKQLQVCQLPRTRRITKWKTNMWFLVVSECVLCKWRLESIYVFMIRPFPFRKDILKYAHSFRTKQNFSLSSVPITKRMHS